MQSFIAFVVQPDGSVEYQLHVADDDGRVGHAFDRDSSGLPCGNIPYADLVAAGTGQLVADAAGNFTIVQSSWDKGAVAA